MPCIYNRSMVISVEKIILAYAPGIITMREPEGEIVNATSKCIKASKQMLTTRITCTIIPRRGSSLDFTEIDNLLSEKVNNSKHSQYQ